MTTSQLQGEATTAELAQRRGDDFESVRRRAFTTMLAEPQVWRGGEGVGGRTDGRTQRQTDRQRGDGGMEGERERHKGRQAAPR
jgi:hypothetical protein